VSDALVRPLAAGEEAEVARITVAAYTAEGLLHGDDPYATELADVGSRRRGAEVWVAELGGRVVGTVTWCPPGSTYREVSTADDQAEFRMLAVDPAVQRRGVARALVDACLDRARLDGACEVVLCSLPQMDAAHGLYRRLGFVRAPELDWWPRESLVLWAFRLMLRP
jgi:ribosomal protein S18 acetylase RimI-like enzyme